MGSRLLPALGLGWAPRSPGRQPPDSWVTLPTSLPRWFVGFALVYGIPGGWDCPAGPVPDYPEQSVLEAKAGRREGRIPEEWSGPRPSVTFLGVLITAALGPMGWHGSLLGCMTACMFVIVCVHSYM